MTVMSDDIRKAIKAHLTMPTGGPTNNRTGGESSPGRAGRPTFAVRRGPVHPPLRGARGEPDQIEEATDALRQAGVMATSTPRAACRDQSTPVPGSSQSPRHVQRPRRLRDAE